METLKVSIFVDIYFMNHLFSYLEYLNEGSILVTSNWAVVNNEKELYKKPGNGAFVFNSMGKFFIYYMFPDSKRECFLGFYDNKDKSRDKKSLCYVKVKENKKETSYKSFTDVNKDQIMDILIDFFDSCDLEKLQNSEKGKFLMGLCKSLKAVVKSEYAEKLPTSYTVFNQTIGEYVKIAKIPELEKGDENYKFFDLFKRFLEFYKSC